MKQIFALVVTFTITITAFSQAGQKWSTSGNTSTSGDFIGSINYEPLIFKTNNNRQGAFTADGDFQLTSLKGTGFNLLQTNDLGIIGKFPLSNANEVLYGDGVWRPLPTPPPSTWELNGTSLFYLGGKVGIGTNTPFTNFDVIGDAYISNNLYVGGGIIITEKINANKEVLTAALRADSIVMDSTKAVYGYSVFKDQVRLENKLQVVGNTQIDGNFRVNGDFIFGDNKRISYLPASGGNPEIIGFGGLPLPPSLDPCFSPTVTTTQFPGMIQTHGNSAYGGSTNILSMGFDGANGIIDMAGTNTQGGPVLLINYYCGKDIFMNTGANGGNVIMTTATMGKVGIGTAEPTAKLDVDGSIKGSGDFISNGFMQSTLGYKFPDGSIQTTAALSLGSQSNPFQEIYVNNYIKIGTNSLWLNSGTGGNNEIYTTNGALVINPVGVSVGGGAASTGENTCINPTLGNVGVGTSNPQDKFQVGEGFNKINMGFLSGDENSDCITSYLGFNAANTTAGWIFNTNGVHNGGAVILASSSGQLNFIIKRNPGGDVLGGDDPCSGITAGINDETLDNSQIFERTKMVITPNGNVGIGTTAPTAKLDVNGSIRTNYNQIFLTADDYHGLGWFATHAGSTIDGPVLYGFSGGALGTNQNGTQKNVLIWKADGSVGIGTTKTTGYKLSVEGKVRAREVEVNAYTWADFVFADDYQLKPLNEVEKYIDEKRHLPNVPSEKEVLEKGINLGEMDAILLQKIEELTLYIIDLEKRLNSIEHENK